MARSAKVVGACSIVLLGLMLVVGCTHRAGFERPRQPGDGANLIGDSTAVNSTSGDSTLGDSTPGDSTPGDSTPGDSTPGDSTLGDSISGDPNPGVPNVDVGPWNPLGNAEPRPWSEYAYAPSNEGGGVSRSIASSAIVGVAYESSGSLVVAYQDEPVGFESSQLVVQRWTGSEWYAVQGSSSLGECPHLDDGDLVADSSGRLVLAASCRSSPHSMDDSSMVLRRFDGADWVDLLPAGGFPGFDQRGNQSVDLAIDGDGTLWVALGGGGVFVWQYDNSSTWSEAGSDMASGTSIYASASVDANIDAREGFDPFIAWRGTDNNIYAARWSTGVGWTSLGSSLSAGGVSQQTARDPKALVDATGRYVVTWASPSGAGFHARRWSGSSWDNIDSTTGMHWAFALPLEVGGQLWAVGRAAVDSWDGSVVVRAFNGSWSAQQAGSDTDRGLSNVDVRVLNVAAAVNAAGDNAAVAWNDGRGDAYVLQYASGTWSGLGEASGGANVPFPTAVMIDRPNLVHDASNGQTYLAWTHSTLDFGIWALGWENGVYAAILNGSTWSEVSSGSLTGSGVAEGWATDAAAGNGLFGLTWTWDSCFVYFRAWDGSTWTELDGSGSGLGINECAGGDTRSPTVALDDAGNPWVAWVDRCGTPNVVVRRWSGAAWEWAGDPVCTADGVSDMRAMDPVIVNGQSGSFLAWSGQAADGANYGVYGKRWNGLAWEEIDGAASGRGIGRLGESAEQIAITVDGLGRVFAAWLQNTTLGAAIHLRVLDEGLWQELDGSATELGLSQSWGGSAYPAIAVDSQNRPVVAWTELDGAAYQIFVKMHDGSQWIQLSDSANNGGISRSDAPSGPSSLAVIDDSACVAWKEPANAGYQIYVRCVPLP